MKIKINDGHYSELMDRLHVQTCIIDEHLVNHPLTKKIKKVKKHIDDAIMSLAEAYHVVGNESLTKKKKK
jgi:S-adenosylhomocysteine hydrolase